MSMRRGSNRTFRDWLRCTTRLLPTRALRLILPHRVACPSTRKACFGTIRNSTIDRALLMRDDAGLTHANRS